MTYEEKLAEARRNFTFIASRFKKLEIKFKTIEDYEEANIWITDNCNKESIVLTEKHWNLLRSKHFNLEPSMEEILASIRRIISEDDGSPYKAIYYFLDDSDMVLFKLRWM